MNVLALDSSYGNPKYLGQLRKLPVSLTENLVSIVACKVWSNYEGDYEGQEALSAYGSARYLNKR